MFKIFSRGDNFNAIASGDDSSIDHEAMEKASERLVPPIAQPNYNKLAYNNFTTTSEADIEEVAKLIAEKEAKQKKLAQENEEKRKAAFLEAAAASIEGSESSSKNAAFDNKENEEFKALKAADESLVLRAANFADFPADEIRFDNYFMTRFASLIHRDNTTVSKARDAMRKAQAYEKFEYFTLIHKAQRKGKFYFTYQDPTDHALDKQITYVTDKKGNIETIVAGSKAYALVSPVQKDINDDKHHFHFTHVNMASKFAQMLVLAVHYNRETIPNTQFLEGQYKQDQAIPEVRSLKSIKYTQFHEFARTNGKRVKSLKSQALDDIRKKRYERREGIWSDSSSGTGSSVESIDIGEKKPKITPYQHYLRTELESSGSGRSK